MIRISMLHLFNAIGDASPINLVLNLVKGLDKTKYDFHIGSGKYTEEAVAERIQCAGARIVNFGKTELLDPKSILEISRYIKDNRIQIVHTHVLRSDIVGGLASHLARKTILFSTKHNLGYVRGQKGWLQRNLLFWPAMYLPDQVITVAEIMRRHIIRKLKFGPKRVITIKNGIAVRDYYKPNERLACRESLGISPEKVMVTYTGRLVPGKGLDCLLRAASKVLEDQENVIFLIAGDGPLQDELKRLTIELGITSNVIFTGFRQDIPEILAATDIFVLPSISEGLPLSLMEAMAARKAVIATPVGGILEILNPEVTGLIVPPNGPEALADTIVRLIKNGDERLKLGNNAYKYASLEFSIKSMVSAYDRIYQLLHFKKLQND